MQQNSFFKIFRNFKIYFWVVSASKYMSQNGFLQLLTLIEKNVSDLIQILYEVALNDLIPIFRERLPCALCVKF
jgi:hypothetical protein